jgi:gamma-glutamyltranspeptidase/glutathione hydrolase
MKRFVFVILAIHYSLLTFSQATQKPPLHGKNWMAITGKPLAATAGAITFQKVAMQWMLLAPCLLQHAPCGMY